MRHYGSRKKRPVCDQDRYVPFRDRNSGWDSGKQIGKASESRKSDVQGGADFSKGKNVSEKNMEAHCLGGYLIYFMV